MSNTFSLSCASKQMMTLKRDSHTITFFHQSTFDYLADIQHVSFVSSHKSSDTFTTNFIPFEFNWNVLFSSQPCYDERSGSAWFSAVPLNVIHADKRRQRDSKLGRVNLCKTARQKKWISVGDEAGGYKRGKRKKKALRKNKEELNQWEHTRTLGTISTQ